MRLALVAQWLRASRNGREHRRNCLRYAGGISAVQVCWALLLLAPPSWRLPLFVLFVVFELAVPLFADARANQTPWHPHHVADRYGAFYIIVLGETVLSTSNAIGGVLGGSPHAGVAVVVAGGILSVFSLWWVYFAREGGEALARIQGTGSNHEFVWGFGHYFVFAADAALGAGLSTRVDFWNRPGEVSALRSAGLVTVPIAVLLAAVWLIQARRSGSSDPNPSGRTPSARNPSARTRVPFAGAVVGVLAATFTPWPELVAGLVCAALVAVEVRFATLLPRT